MELLTSVTRLPTPDRRGRAASLFGLVLLYAGVALAGGDSWQVRVLSISPAGSDPVTIAIQPLEDGYEWKGCAKVTIVSTLKREVIGLRTWSASLGQDKYDAALAELRDAAEKRTIIRFGSMGSGLKATSNKCKLLSRGLEVLTEHSGATAIFSYHDPI
jgi:hypothetical protein